MHNCKFAFIYKHLRYFPRKGFVPHPPCIKNVQKKSFPIWDNAINLTKKK